jgi:hypothetical protein
MQNIHECRVCSSFFYVLYSVVVRWCWCFYTYFQFLGAIKSFPDSVGVCPLLKAVWWPVYFFGVVASSTFAPYILFSSPNPKNHVSFSDHFASLCKLFTFWISSWEPLNRIKPNLVAMIPTRSFPSVVTLVSIGPQTWLPAADLV